MCYNAVMKTNIIKEIWEIRGTIDNAIATSDIDLFNRAKERFLELYANGMHLKSLATASAGKHYETEEEVLNENKEVVKSIQFSSPIEVLWYTRDMFDTFVRTSQQNRDNQEELHALIEAVQINIDEIIEMFKGFHDKTTLQERITLQLIKNQIENEYNNYFSDELKTI